MIHPRISVTTISSWNWTVKQDIAFLGELGVGVMGVPTTKFGNHPEADIAAIRASDLVISSVSAGSGSLVESEEATLSGLRPSIDMTSAMGASSLYFVTGPTPPQMSTDEAFAKFEEFLPAALAYARDQGVTLSIEHNSVSSREIGFVHTLAGAAELCRKTGLGICLELQNCWYEPDLPRLFRDSLDLITIVQVSDFRVGEPLKMNRRVPGDGSMPLEWMIGELLDAGYTGLFEIEIVGPAIEEEGYAPAIRRSVDWLAQRLTHWGA